ncbi:PREDICTED: trichohyalin-like [Cyprinodon variegatus]|uniref:trichohyalin-like n=1 Tax=Cyprinodon variegatus TaxID=28743 RepID=UPI000742758D|nr:PREDICTED: trichohyalin-like [Cyprinodon variegatus]
MDDQHRLLDFTRIPQIILHRIDRLLEYAGKEEDFSEQQLWKQERNSSLDQEEPEPLQMKEEQLKPEDPWTKEETMELPISEQEEQLKPEDPWTKEETMELPISEQEEQLKPEDPWTKEETMEIPISEQEEQQEAGDLLQVGKEEDFSEQQLWKQERNSSLDQEEPEPLQMKEEQLKPEDPWTKEETMELPISEQEEQLKPEDPWTKEETMELPISEQEEQLLLKQEEGDKCMVTPPAEEKDHIKPEPMRNQVVYQDLSEVQNQDSVEIHPKHSGSEGDKGLCYLLLGYSIRDTLGGARSILLPAHQLDPTSSLAMD